MTDITNHVFGLNDVYDRVKRSVWPVWIDATPDAFSFTDQTAVQPSATITSNTITVAGLGAAVSVPITITGGTYSKNSGAYTSTAGTVVNGDTVSVRHTSSASGTTAVNTVLTIGPLTDTFTSTTAALDTVPDAFSFTTATGVNISTLTTSNTVTISGLTGAAAISITGGNYSINSGAYTASSGTISNGNTLTVQHTSSASYSTNVVTTVTIGGVNGTFTSTTRAIDAFPTAFTFTAVTNATPSTNYTSNTITVAGMDSGASAAVSISNGLYSKNSAATSSAATTAVNGDTFSVTATSSASYSTARSAVLTIGGEAGTYSITTRAEDTTPSAFTFTDVTGATRSSTYTSNTITVAGMDSGASAAVSITGGTYSKNSGSYVSTAGTATNGDTFSVRGVASGSYSTTVNVVLTIGGVSSTYSIATEAAPADATPNQFTFTPQTGVAINATYTSNTITISGIDTSTPVSITGGTYSKNGNATYTSSAGTAVNGDTFSVRVVSSGSYSTTTSATLSVGGITDSFDVTTRGIDNTPNSFTFTAVTGRETSTLINSNTITVAGMDTGASATATADSVFFKNGTSFAVNANTTAVNGDVFYVQKYSSNLYSTTTSATLTIGGVSDTFDITTRAADTTPSAFSFTDVTNADTTSFYTSNTITVSGMDAGQTAAVSVSGGNGYKKNGGTRTSTAGTAANGDTFDVQVNSSSSYSTAVSCTLTIGGVSDTYTVTTGVDTLPDAFSFPAQTGVAKNNLRGSNQITVSGLGSGVSATVSVSGDTGASYSKNNGSFTSTNGTAVNGDLFMVAVNGSASGNTSTSATLTIGDRSATFTITTVP